MRVKKLVMRLSHLAERVVPGLLTCAEADRFVDDYLEDRLEPKVRRRFERHLSMCPPCRGYLEAYRRSLHLTRAAGASSPAVMPDDLLQAILAARDAEQRD
ncbi:MAG: zf-HC2 domain-containing protein [Ectothiorhodospiraceae bacterium]|nr:zf-HC2 domain-containing protein [Ectothiorhodospiraceae bacterium]